MSNKNDSLGDRMKKYEAPFKMVLPQRLPVILRVDGKSFHTYTKPLKKDKGKAYEPSLVEVMNLTAIELCKQIQGVQVAYVQSDEISLFLHNYKNINSQPWFGNEIQKMVSISASIASTTFTMNSWKIWANEENPKDKLSFVRPVQFDSRVFILPEHEVVNSFIWRQQDATRNSVQMLARSLFTHKECNNKNNSELQDMCQSVGRNWNNEPTHFKRGRCIVQKEVEHVYKDNLVIRKQWVVDDEIPVFTQDREYIEKFIK